MKAILIGATGLVGSHILSELLNDREFTEVTVFVRKTTGIVNPKLTEIINPMSDIDSLQDMVSGDVLFNAIGTTIKKAGSQQEQTRIDRDLPVAFARMAATNGVKIMLNISSVGASPKGGFYLRTKAEMEKGTEEFFPGRIYHFRPGLLVGKRPEFRLFELISKGAMKVIDPLLWGKNRNYRSMPVDKLARAMVSLAKNPAGKPIVLYYPQIMACL
jgi:uncharacterized protein YbjT (DUF2867 family)